MLGKQSSLSGSVECVSCVCSAGCARTDGCCQVRLTKACCGCECRWRRWLNQSPVAVYFFSNALFTIHQRLSWIPCPSRHRVPNKETRIFVFLSFAFVLIMLILHKLFRKNEMKISKERKRKIVVATSSSSSIHEASGRGLFRSSFDVSIVYLRSRCQVTRDLTTAFSK